MKRTTLALPALFSLLFSVAAFSPASAAEKTSKASALPVQATRAFPNLRLRRPIVVTHAGDGSNRIFVAEQQGVIRFFENDQDVKKTTIFFDHEKNVVYKDKENEQGLLGFAFHPKYKENGEFFLYYTTTDEPLTSVVSRFRVSADDPNRADPNFEEEIMRIKQPFWNHNGGTIVFGPDGYLYIALGDGGAGNDPQNNAQNLATLLGSILRIDVDHKTNTKEQKLAYAIPKDNPFVGHGALARPEIWAYGLRNVWRMSFDRKTGDFWAGDVGQGIWEEINIITRGGNYGWNLREAKHKFGPGGFDANKYMIDPVWEYHHDIGKSITGGGVYRGSRAPQLQGAYVYADYVSGKIWALQYDQKAKKVISNQTIEGPPLPFITFGEDEKGEMYMTDSFGMFYHFTPKRKK